MTPITKDQRRAVVEAAEKVFGLAELPWSVSLNYLGEPRIMDDSGNGVGNVVTEAEAAYIVAACNAIPAYESALAAAEAEIESLKGIQDERALFDAENDLAFKDLDAEIADLKAERDALRAALATYDAKVAECPLNDERTRKRVGRGPCPLCRATASDGCGVVAGASAVFINAARQVLSQEKEG